MPSSRAPRSFSSPGTRPASCLGRSRRSRPASAPWSSTTRRRTARRSSPNAEGRYLDVPRDAPFDVEQPAAAALLVRRAAFAEIGGFDPAFRPAWYEDVDLCARLREAGWRVRYVPAAPVAHDGGAAMRSVPY